MVTPKPADQNCPRCGSTETFLSGKPKELKLGGISQLCNCRNCKKNFVLGEKRREQSPRAAGQDCPQCGSSNTVLRTRMIRESGNVSQQCKCKDCNKRFNLGNVRRSTPKTSEHSCPKCGSSKTIEKELVRLKSGIQTMRCFCRECGKSFFPENNKKNAEPAGENCPHCNSKNTVKKGNPIPLKSGDLSQACLCQDCGKNFTLNNQGRIRQKRTAEPADRNCPYCTSSNTIKHGSPRLNKWSVSQPCLCHDCNRGFNYTIVKEHARPAEKNCPRCDSSNTVKKGNPVQLKSGATSQYCLCIDCGKNFTLDRKREPARPLEQNCPYCNSSNTVKNGRSKQNKSFKSQPCLCHNCGKKFTVSDRKKLFFYIKGKLVFECFFPPGLQHSPDIACPACKAKKAVLKCEFQDGQSGNKIREHVCLGCGHKFRGEGREWNTANLRKFGKAVPLIPWKFDDDKWDLRELYPQIEEYKFSVLFLNLGNCGAEWFKNLVKLYILWCVENGSEFSTLKNIVSQLGFFGRFLEKQKVASMEVINRYLLAIYWEQERGHLKNNKLDHEKYDLRAFFSWGNTAQHFKASTILITYLDRPPSFEDDPDPLEEAVLKGIRDNLHVLPDPIQLMFMLGFWLATRPNELCRLRKNCVSLDPDGSIWWIEFERDKCDDVHRLPLPSDLVRLIECQKSYITELYGDDYPYLFCHYQQIGITTYPNYPRQKAVRRPPMASASYNPMVKAIRHLIERCEIRDSNNNLAYFTGSILRASRATDLIRSGYSLEFIRVWLKHRRAETTKRHYTKYKPGDLLDVACVMANMDEKFIPYDSKPNLLGNPELHELDGLTMPNGEPLYGYCIFTDFCPRFGNCYVCGFHIASADKLPLYKAQLEKLLARKSQVFNYGSSEILNSFTNFIDALEGKIQALESML